MSFVELAGLERLIARVHRLEKPDATPLMTTWIKIFEEDNRKGVLAGTDKDGNPMAPVKYRPKTAKPLKIGSKGAAAAARPMRRSGLRSPLSRTGFPMPAEA